MNEKIARFIIGLLIISCALVVIEDQQNRQAELRQDALVAVNKLQNDPNITLEQAEVCATIINKAVDSRAIVSYTELGVSSECTIGEMVKHVAWGQGGNVKMQWVSGWDGEKETENKHV